MLLSIKNISVILKFDKNKSDKPIIPHIIYSLWYQGINNAPPLVRLNFERWAKLNPGYTLKILNETTAREILSDSKINIDKLSIQSLSDILRSMLLLETGGIWVDASLFPMKSLDEWLPEKITSSGFFAFEKPGPDRPISSWFLACSKNNKMILAWYKEALKYWATERTVMQTVPNNPIEAISKQNEFPYFWSHYLFQKLIERDRKFAKAWEACTKIPADAPCALQMLFLKHQRPEHSDIFTVAAGAPVHKLNWRAEYPIDFLSSL